MTDKPKLAFVKLHCKEYGPVLVPDMLMDKDVLDRITTGERLHIEIKQFRNIDRLRAWWSLLRECIKSGASAIHGDEWTLEALADFVKIKAGHVDIFQLGGGEIYKRAKSIAFTSDMTEDEFVLFFKTTELILAQEFGYAKEEADG